MSIGRRMVLPALWLLLLPVGEALAQGPTQFSNPLASWQPELVGGGPVVPVLTPAALQPSQSRTRSHTGTGLLIGGIVGTAATGVFLATFCSDPDTSCGADEVGRAALVFALPAAALGALIGSLVRTEE